MKSRRSRKELINGVFFNHTIGNYMVLSTSSSNVLSFSKNVSPKFIILGGLVHVFPYLNPADSSGVETIAYWSIWPLVGFSCDE